MTKDNNSFSTVPPEQDSLLAAPVTSIYPNSEQQALNAPPETHRFGSISYVPIESTPTKGWLGTFWRVLRPFIGPGSFALPWMLLKAGVWAGALSILLLALWSNFTMKLVIRSKSIIEQRTNTAITSYIELALFTLGMPGVFAVAISTLLAQLGICGAYLVFIAECMETILPAISMRGWIGICTIPCILLSFLRRHGYLMPIDVLGSVASLVAMGVIWELGVDISWPIHVSEFPGFVWSNYPHVFGVGCFVLCMHSVAIPTQRSINSRRSYFSHLNWAMTLIAIVNVLFAFFVYTSFGEDTHPIALMSLTDKHKIPNRVVITAAKSWMSVVLLFAYPVALRPAVEVLEEALFTSRTVGLWWRQNVLRTVLVVATIGIAMGVPSFGELASLVGALCVCMYTLVIPPLMHLRICWDEMARWQIFLRIFLCFLGVVGTILGVVVAIDTVSHMHRPNVERDGM